MGTKINSQTQLEITGDLLPKSADGASLGSATYEYSDLFLADGSTIQLGNDQDIIITTDQIRRRLAVTTNGKSFEIGVSGSLAGIGYLSFHEDNGIALSSSKNNGNIGFSVIENIGPNAWVQVLQLTKTGAVLNLKNNTTKLALNTAKTDYMSIQSAGTSGQVTELVASKTLRLNAGSSDHVVAKLGNTTAATQFLVQASDGERAMDVDATGAAVVHSTLFASGTVSIGPDADGTDRILTFGHSTLKTVVGIDDDQDVFAINTGNAFDSVNDFEIDASGNVTIGNGNLTVGGTSIDVDAASALTIGASVGANVLTVGGGTTNVHIPGDLTVAGTRTELDITTLGITGSLRFEGATANDFETTLGVVDPTADRTINLANVDGTLIPFSAASTTAIAATPAEINLLDIDVAGASEISLNLDDKFIVHDINYLGAPETRKVKISSLVKMNRTGSYQVQGQVSIAASASNASGKRVVDDLIIGKRGASQYERDTRVIFESNRNHTANRYGMGYNKTDETFVIFSTGSDPNVALPDDGKYSGGGDSNDNQLLKMSGSGVVDFPQHDGSTKGLALAGTVVTTTAAELNVVDGGTAATSTTLVDADRFVCNDAGTMKQVALSDLTTYVQNNSVIPRTSLFFSASQSDATNVNTGGQGRMSADLYTASLEVNAHGYPRAGSLEIYLNGMLLTPSGSLSGSTGPMTYPITSGTVGTGTPAIAGAGIGIWDYYVSGGTSGGTLVTTGPSQARVWENPTGSLPSDGGVYIVLAETLDSDDILTIKYLAS